MDQNETHLMMLKVTIHKIQLSVRFPCSLTFQLKLQNKTVDCRGAYELIKGSCTPEETLRLQLQLQKKEDDTYRDKQVKIVIYMTSTNGKIPAGSVSLNLGSLRAGSSDLLTSVIDKCPDKSASVNYTYALDYLRSVAKNSWQSKQSGIYGKFDQSSVSSSSRVRYMAASPSYQNLRSAESKYSSYSKPSLEKKNSANSSSAAYQSSTYHILNRSNVPQHDTDYDQRRSRVSGFAQDDDVRKLADLERQKTDHIRQISKLKSQANRKQYDDKTQTDEHYTKLRQQFNQLSAQNEGLRQKVKNLQRRDKQLTQGIKQLRQQVQRKKEKNYQQEFIRMESQSILDEKQKLIREMQSQIKQYEQQISDLKINMSTQQKRIEFKEVSLKDQLAKLGEKYQQSEAQRQKAVIQLNAMLEQLQSTEKKNQISIKQKDRAQAEQKNKLIKKSQSLVRTIQQQKDQLDQKCTLILDLQRDIKNLQKKLNETQVESSQYKAEGRNLNSQLEKQKENNKNLQKEKQRLQQVERMFTQHKKKYQQLEAQEQSTKRNLDGVSKINVQLQNKIKQLQEQVASKSQEISSLMTKIYNLNSQIQTYKKEQQNYNKEAETLSMNNLNAASKIEELRSKLDQLQMAYNQLEMQSQEQISYMIKSKQYLESELEQSKWNCDKFKDSYEDMTAKSKNLSAEVLELNRRIMESQERITKLEQLLADARTTINVNGQQKQMQLSKQKELQEKLKERNDEIYELNKKISKIESENFMLLEKQKQTQKFYADKLQSQQGVNKTKEMKINQAIQNISKLQVQIISKQELISSLQTSTSRLTTENQYVKQQLKISKKQNADLQDKINELSEQNENLFDKINAVTQELEKEKNMKTQTNKNLSKTNKQLQDYKLSTTNALQHLLQQITKDLNPNSTTTQISLISFPEERLSALQVQAMKKRNNLILKYQNQIRQLMFQIKHLEDEISVTKKTHSSKEEHLELVIESEKTKLKNLQADATLEKQQLLEKINMLEDKLFQITAELQKLNIENQQNKLLVLEKENLTHQLEFQINNFKNQIKALQNNVKILQQENVRVKKNYQNTLLSSNEETSVQIDKLKKSIIQNEKKINNLQKTLSQKQQAISKIGANLDNMTHLKEKSDQKMVELGNRYSQLAQQRKNGLQNQRNYEKIIKKLQEKITFLEGENVQINKKLQQIQIQKKKIQESLSEEQIMRIKVIGELETKNQQLKILEEAMKDTGDKSKKNTEKNIQEIKKLKQQIIALNSSIELKVFEINQNQNLIKSLKISNQELTQENANKKTEISDLQNKLQQIKNTNLLMTQQLQKFKGEKGSFQDQVRVMKQTIINLESLLDENQTNLETMTLKQREITKLKQDISSKDRNYEKSVQDLRSQISQLKKQISNKTQRQQDLKKKIRELESQIQNHLYDSQAQKKNWQQNADNQRKKLIYELQGVKEENKLLAEQFQFQREQMNHQLDQAAAEISELKQIINDSQMQMNNSSAKNTQQIQKIKSLQLQLKNCKQEWQKEKLSYVPTQKQLKQIQNEIAKYQKYAFELQKKNKQLTELAKKRLAQQPKSSSGELLREVNTILLRNKTKIISRCGERQRDQVIADFKQIHEKLEGAIKSYHLLK